LRCFSCELFRLEWSYFLRQMMKPGDLITRVIDESDYYLLIIGGRYGSLGADGVGFTEKEYDYAVRQKKPVMAFLHKSPETLPFQDNEGDPVVREKDCSLS
jgi:hypothetical protein